MTSPQRAALGEIFDRPTRTGALPCTACGRPRDPLGRCRRRLCPGYYPTWCGDAMSYIMTNSIRLAMEGGGCDMVTITPPGAEDLPWDTAKCKHLPGERCSGERGCIVHPDALARFHADFAPRLDRMMRAARERLRRMGWLMPRYVVALEPQGRGALHVHLITSVRDRPAAAALASSLRVLAPRYGFGRRVGWDPHRGEDRAAERGVGAYLAKLARYMAKEASGESHAMAEVLRAMPGRRVFRASTKLTAETRATMRNMRLRRWAHHYCRGRGLVPPRDPADVERLWQRVRAEADARQREATFLVGLELAFERPPPPWQDAPRLAVDWWRTCAPIGGLGAEPPVVPSATPASTAP